MSGYVIYIISPHVPCIFPIEGWPDMISDKAPQLPTDDGQLPRRRLRFLHLLVDLAKFRRGAHGVQGPFKGLVGIPIFSDFALYGRWENLV